MKQTLIRTLIAVVLVAFVLVLTEIPSGKYADEGFPLGIAFLVQDFVLAVMMVGSLVALVGGIWIAIVCLRRYLRTRGTGS
jgi:cell division protein FtsX